MNFTHYHCQNGFAKPVNQIEFVDQLGIQAEYQKAYNDFEKLAKENTVSCSEDLSGEYKVESVNILWRYKTKKDVWFFYKDQSVFDGSYERYRVYMIEEMNYVACDKYLQLKPVVKESIKGAPLLENAAHDYAESDDWSADMNIYGCLKNGFIAGANWMNDHKKEPEVKQQFGEWISVDDRMPETTSLLLTTSKMILIGDWYDGIWRVAGKNRWAEKIEGGFELLSDLRTGDITHWMILPPLPTSPPKSI